MERREVVVKVVSGGQNSLRGQIGLERVLRWKSRFRAWMRFGTSGQAKLEQERRDMQHKYRLGDDPWGQLGDDYVSRDEMQDGSSSSSSGRAVVAVAVVVAVQRHTGQQRVAMLLQARSRLGESLAMATTACPMHTKSKSRDRFIAGPITAQDRPATAFSEARCHARAKFTTINPKARASNTPEHPSATLRDKC